MGKECIVVNDPSYEELEIWLSLPASVRVDLI